VDEAAISLFLFLLLKQQAAGSRVISCKPATHFYTEEARRATTVDIGRFSVERVVVETSNSSLLNIAQAELHERFRNGLG